MKKSALLLLGTLMLAACSQGGDDAPIITSAHSERGWVETCRVAPDLVGEYPARCTDQQVVWAISYLSLEAPNVFVGRLGTPRDSLRAEVTLLADLEVGSTRLVNDIVFVRGVASAGRTIDGELLVHLRDAEFLGVQTEVDGPKQGPFAPEITMAEFGTLCLDISDVLFENRCAGRRVLWYAIYEGPMQSGEQILRLPFQDNRFAAQMSMSEDITWRVDPTSLAGQLVVIEGRLGSRVVRDETRIPHIPISHGHIISFPRVGPPIVELTGVE